MQTEDLPFPAYHLWKTNSSFVIIDRLYFEKDYVFDLKIGVINPRNGSIEIEKWALGDRFRNNANLRWRKPERRGKFYYLYGILPRRELYLKLKIKTNDIPGIGSGYLYFVHLYKKYYFKITLATVRKFHFNSIEEELIPYIAGYNFEYGSVTEEISENGGIHPLDPLVRNFSLEYVEKSPEETVRSLMQFVMNVFKKGINVTYIGDYPDYYYLERFKKYGPIWGVCSERSLVLVSLLRSLGIPARIVYAIGFPVSHAFVEVYVKNGWINVDTSYGVFDDPDFYFKDIVRELSTLQVFYGGVKGDFINNTNEQFVKYPYQENLNYRYLKDSITIMGISGILLGEDYHLTIRVRWATKASQPRIKFVFQDAVTGEDVLIVNTKALLFKFSEANLYVKLKTRKFATHKGEKYVRLKIYLVKEGVLDYAEFPEPIKLKCFSF